MTGAETKLATAAIATTVKSGEGIVKLLFGPQIEQLKNSLKDRNVKKQVSEGKIERIFSDYLSSVFEKCSTLNSIIFTQQVFPLEDIYEPIDLYEKDSFSDMNVLSDIPNEGKPYLNLLIHNDLTNNITLIDVAGMGKSTFSKYLVIKVLKNKLYTKIPLFIELRKVQEGETLTEHIVKAINLKHKNVITEEMLFKLMENGSFLVVLDGFDEVNEKSVNSLGNSITELSQNFKDNQFILTSRNKSYIPNLHNQLILHFKHLKLEQIKALLLKYDKAANINVGHDLIKHKNFQTLNYELFETPLMVNLLYLAFGHNKTIDSHLVTFYNEMIDALYKGHDLTKMGFDRQKKSKLKFEDFKTLFNSFCFVSLFNNKISFESSMEVLETIKKASTLSGIEVNSAEFFLTDLLENVPLLTKDGLELKFIHKTIMEFFAAQFMNYSEIRTDLIAKLFVNCNLNTFAKSFDFLYQINSSLFVKEVAQTFLSDYLKYTQEQYLDLNDSFKTLLFFDNNIAILIENSSILEHGKQNKIRDKYENASAFHIAFEDIGSCLISIFFTKNDKYSYIPQDFLNSIFVFEPNTSILNIMGNSDFLKEDFKYVLDNFELNKEYHIEKYAKDLQKSKIISALLSAIIINKYHDEKHHNIQKSQLCHIDKDKCINLLSESTSKMDVLG